MTQQEITNKYNQMLTGIDKVYSVKGKINCYTCESCRHITKCKHIDQGVTPFMHTCEACGEMAQSNMGRDISPLQQPTEEWYRPTLEEVLNMDPESGTFEHVINGGLLCRKIQEVKPVLRQTLNNNPNITEHRAIKLFDEKYGRDKVTRFMKVREEFRELSEAFSEYLETGNDKHLRDEICHLHATITHLASLFDLYQKQMLNTAIDKVKTRETDPGYKRYPNTRGIRNVGVIGGIGGASPFESQVELLKYHLENNDRVLFIGEGSFEDVKCKYDFFSNLEKMKQIEMEIKAPMPVLNDCKVETYFEPREPKPWDRKEMNRLNKPSYKSKRRK